MGKSESYTRSLWTCNLQLMVWFGKDIQCLKYCKIRNYEKQEDSGSMPNSLSAGMFLARSAVLHSVIVPVCVVFIGRIFLQNGK